MSRYKKPWKVWHETWVLDANGHRVCIADSPEAAAEVVNLANTSYAAEENTRLFLEASRDDR